MLVKATRVAAPAADKRRRLQAPRGCACSTGRYFGLQAAHMMDDAACSSL